jgi:hypothetical protein
VKIDSTEIAARQEVLREEKAKRYAREHGVFW